MPLPRYGELTTTESRIVMEKKREDAAIRRGITGEPMEGETDKQAFKRRSVPYSQMDPETKIEFEINAKVGDIWNYDSDEFRKMVAKAKADKLREQNTKNGS
jgi:hypothetical protein